MELEQLEKVIEYMSQAINKMGGLLCAEKQENDRLREEVKRLESLMNNNQERG